MSSFEDKILIKNLWECVCVSVQKVDILKTTSKISQHFRGFNPYLPLWAGCLCCLKTNTVVKAANFCHCNADSSNV